MRMVTLGSQLRGRWGKDSRTTSNPARRSSRLALRPRRPAGPARAHVRQERSSPPAGGGSEARCQAVRAFGSRSGGETYTSNRRRSSPASAQVADVLWLQRSEFHRGPVCCGQFRLLFGKIRGRFEKRPQVDTTVNARRVSGPANPPGSRRRGGRRRRRAFPPNVRSGTG